MTASRLTYCSTAAAVSDSASEGACTPGNGVEPCGIPFTDGWTATVSPLEEVPSVGMAGVTSPG